MWCMTDGEPVRRGAMLVHPVAIAAVLALLLNDHVLKAASPGFLTGKVSDVAGLVFFPLLLAEVAAPLLRRDTGRLVPAAAALTAVAFALVKLTPAGAATFAWGLGAAQWLVVLALTGHATLRPVAVAMDPTDLLALPAPLIAVMVARMVPMSGRRVQASVVPARHQLFPAALAVLMGFATIATGAAPPPPTGVVLTEQLRVAQDQVAVRHVVWSVRKPANVPTRLLLEVSTRDGTGESDATASTISLSSGPDASSIDSIRIVPDDARLAPNVTRDGNDYGFTTVSLDLAAACQDGCTGGARVFVNGLTARLVMRLTTGDATDDPLLSLEVDGVGDYTGPIATADSGAQEAQIELDHVRLAWRGAYTLHVAAAALEAPSTSLRVILRTRIAGVDDKAGMGAEATLGIGASMMPIDIGPMALWHVLDLSDRCSTGMQCEIPISLDVKSAPPAPPNNPPGQSPGPSPTPGRGVDVYRWSVRVEVEAFDGRQIPADGAWITPAQP